MDDLKFNDTIEKYITSTHGHADEFNKRQNKLLENDKYLKSELETKAVKDGALQIDLNAQKLNGKTASSTPLTSNKTDIIEMINEVFTSGNNVKNNTVDALLQVDESLQISKKDNWDTIINNIGKVSVGKKWAYFEITNMQRGNEYKLNISFKPSLVAIINTYAGNGAVSVYLSGYSKYNGEWIAISNSVLKVLEPINGLAIQFGEYTKSNNIFEVFVYE